MDKKSDEDLLPRQTRAAIKCAFPLKQALDYEACLEKRYYEIVESKGRQAAELWLRDETRACYLKAIGRWGRWPITFVINLLTNTGTGNG